MSILKKIDNWIFTATGLSLQSSEVTSSDYLPEVIALLIKLAEADGDFSSQESAKIISLIGKGEKREAMQKFSEAQKKSKHVSSSELLQLLNQELSLPQKRDLIEMLYQLVKTDDRTESAESKFVSSVVSGLNISDDMHADAYRSALEKRKVVGA